MRFSIFTIAVILSLLSVAFAHEHPPPSPHCYKKVKKCCYEFYKCGHKYGNYVHKYKCNFKKCYPKCYKVCSNHYDIYTHKMGYKCYKKCQKHCVKVIAVCKVHKYFVRAKYCPHLRCYPFKTVGSDEKPPVNYGQPKITRISPKKKHILKYIKIGHAHKPVHHKPAHKPAHKPMHHKPAHKPIHHKPAPKPMHHKPAQKPAHKPDHGAHAHSLPHPHH